MINPQNRLCIYALCEQSGNIDRYVPQMLTAVRRYCKSVVVIGADDLPMSALEGIADTSLSVKHSKNGSNLSLYYAAIERLGPSALGEFDEVLFVDDTLMGPVYPLEDLFSSMDVQETDFWGIAASEALPGRRGGTCEYVTPFLQACFMAMRKSVFSAPGFVHSLQNAASSRARGEEALTKSLVKQGFRWKSWLPAQDSGMDPLVYDAAAVVEKMRCPVFKRSSFYYPYDKLYMRSLGDQGRRLLTFLQEKELYDTDLIWESVLRTCNLADIHRCVGLYHVLPSRGGDAASPSMRVALILHLHYQELFAACRQYAYALPQGTDLYITTTSPEKAQQLEMLFSDDHWGKLEVRVIQNRGRDISSLLVGCRDVPGKYDLICFAHDKRSHQGEEKGVGAGFFTHCFENIMGTSDYVQQVIGLFRQESRLGMAFPPPPCHSSYVRSIENEWTDNFDNTKALARKMGLTIPISRDAEAVAPLGTMFWFRPAALEKLFDMKWSYEDFPPEPGAADGTLLHAVERLYPFVAQQAGYYCSWITSDAYASRYTLNLYYSLQNSQRACYEESLIRNICRRWKRSLKRIMPQTVWKKLRKIKDSLK